MSFSNSSLKVLLAAALAAALSVAGLSQGAPITSDVPRAQEVQALIATLQSATASQHDKVVACHRLAIVGTKEAVPALAALLTDEKLSHLARHALEPMTDPAAGAALRAALEKTNGLLLVGVINTIGFRRDAAATAPLAKLLANADSEIATAAAAALGRIGTGAAAQELSAALVRASGPRQLAIADASLTCADNLVRTGKRADAAAIYDRMCGPAFPAHIRTAAMCGAITARESGGVSLLLKQLETQDAAMLAAGWRAARELPGTDATKALAAEVAKLPPEKQVLLLQVLGDRGDKIALRAVIKAAESKEESVRIAALQVLPRVDDGSSTPPILLRAITSGRGAAEASAALASLAQVGGADTNSRILATLPSVPPSMRAKLIGVLGARRAENASGELLKLAGGSDPEIAKASFRALAQVGRPADLPEVIRLSISCRDDAVRVPADLAVYAVAMKITPKEKRAEPVLAALAATKDPATRASLLRPLGAIIKASGGTAAALEAVKAAYADPDAQIRTAALRCLADWPDARPAGLLLEIVKRNDDPVHRELAMRGGIRMAANVAAGRDATGLDALAWCTAANGAVRSKDEKLILVSGLGGLNRIEGLQMLQPYLNDAEVQTEAALAVIELAGSLASTPHAEAARRALDRVTRTTKDADVRRKAAKMAKSLAPKA